MKQKIFSIGLVYYSGEIFLLGCIKSLLAQTEQDFEILFRDQTEDFEGKKFLEKNFFPVISSTMSGILAVVFIFYLNNKYLHGYENIL